MSFDRAVWVDGREVPMRPWQVGLSNMSEPSLARCMRGLLACAGRVSDAHGIGGRRLGYTQDWRGSVVLMVWLPDGFLARFREVARPHDVEPPSRINVGMHRYRCGVDGCEDACPPGHHGGAEWREVRP